MNLHFHPEAKDDIKTIAEKYADVSKLVHERFWIELENSPSDTISIPPAIGGRT